MSELEELAPESAALPEAAAKPREPTVAEKVAKIKAELGLAPGLTLKEAVDAANEACGTCGGYVWVSPASRPPGRSRGRRRSTRGARKGGAAATSDGCRQGLAAARLS